jgi:hypothetical protein
LKLSKKVIGTYKRELRQSWLDRALVKEELKMYSQSDIYLIEWFLVGDCDIFPLVLNGTAVYDKIWESILDHTKLSLMDSSPTMEYCCRLFDSFGKGEWPRCSYHLHGRTKIRHSVVLLVDTAGNAYHRSRRTGQFCKVGVGGGKKEGSLINRHFSCREGLMDEMGVDFHNRAVLWVSHPILEILAPHEKEQSRVKIHDLVGSICLARC